LLSAPSPYDEKERESHQMLGGNRSIEMEVSLVNRTNDAILESDDETQHEENMKGSSYSARA